VFPALLVMQLIWFMAWIPGMEQGIVTGLAVASAAARARSTSALPHLGPQPSPVTTVGG